MKITIAPRLQSSVWPTLSLSSALLVFAVAASAEDWPMFGRDKTRNAVNPEKNPPLEWDIKSGQGFKWKAQIGSVSFSAPVVANGFVWIGTNNEYPRDPSQADLAGVLMCFRESDGKFLYQHVSPARQGSTFNQARTGNPNSPLIEGDQLWFVTIHAEVVCLDIAPLNRGEGVPQQRWKLDMTEELGVFQRPAVMGGGGICSIGASYRNLIYVITGNGTDWSSTNVPSPLSPALICLDKNTGKLVWEDHSSGANILFGEWGSPLVIELAGRAQVIAPQGDGWVRSFDALTGELIWKFDINRKDGKWLQTRGFFSTAPVFYRKRIYIAIGNYREFGELPGRLVCLDPTKRGDISIELEDGPGNGKPNPNSGAVWHFDGILRSMSTVAIHDGLVIAPDFGGFVHCLDAETGKDHWRHDMRAHVLSSPLIAEDKVYVGDEDGDLAILALSTERRVLAENTFNGVIYSSPVFANGALYVAAGDTLFAIQKSAGSDWPQWRGPDRSNVSRETGLLKQWPTNGPPLLWKATGLGEGMASVSVAGGRLFTVGYRDGSEFVWALNARSGEKIWASRIGPSVPENSAMRWLSQRTPTVDEDRVYGFVARGELLCLRTVDGRILWKKNYPEEFASRTPIWGFCDHPLLDGEKLICSPGGTNGSVVALNKRTGDVIWKTKVPSVDSASYAATVLSEAGGLRQYIVFLSKGLVGFAASDGRMLWRFDKSAAKFGNSYTPIVQGDFIFSANGYGGGMALLKLVREGDGLIALEQYHQPFNFSPFQDSTVAIGDHVYCVQGPGRPICIEIQTGKLAWGPVDTRARDRAALTCADGRLYIRRASGAIVLVEATPKEYVEKGSFVIPDREEVSGVTSPVIAGGRLYLRDNDRLLCYDVRSTTGGGERPAAGTIALAITPAESASEAPDVGRPRTGRDRAPDAVFVPTPQDIVEKMLDMAQLKETDTVYALGSGDGRFLITAARKYGCKAVGFEIDRRLVEQSRENVKQNGVERLVRIEHEDLFTVDLSGATVIAVYLPSPLLERLLPQLEKLKPGSRVVSHQFEIPGVPPETADTVLSKEDGDQHRLVLWTAPLRRSRPATN